MRTFRLLSTLTVSLHGQTPVATSAPWHRLSHTGILEAPALSFRLSNRSSALSFRTAASRAGSLLPACDIARSVHVDRYGEQYKYRRQAQNERGITIELQFIQTSGVRRQKRGPRAALLSLHHRTFSRYKGLVFLQAVAWRRNSSRAALTCSAAPRECCGRWRSAGRGSNDRWGVRRRLRSANVRLHPGRRRQECFSLRGR